MSILEVSWLHSNERNVLGPIEGIVFFGGGRLLVKGMLLGREKGVFVHAILAPRHAEENIALPGAPALSLKNALEANAFAFDVAEDINQCESLSALTRGNVLGLGLGESYTFTRKIVELFRGRLFDLMVIRLPQYRGGAHFTWQILRGSRVGCWHIQEINEEMIPGRYDSGRIWKTREYLLDPRAKTPEDYFAAAEQEGFLLLKEFLEEIQAGAIFSPKPLQEEFSTYFPRLNTLLHGWIDWSWNAEEIERFCNAFDHPYAGASTFLNGQRVFLKECRRELSEGLFHPFMAGLVYKKRKDALFLALRDGALIVGRCLNEKGEDIKETVLTGMRFVTPRHLLDEALACSVDYDARGLRQK